MSQGVSGDGQQDPHDVPITDEQKQQLREETAKFTDAVAKVKELRDAVERETQNGIPANPFDAHQALDTADFIVPRLPKIAQDSEIPMEQLETINVAAKAIRECFEQVHQNIDDKADPDFASIQEEMDAKIAELEAVIQ